ncbi:isoprenylcysteine carboxylmethyltransferase family protein [Salinisphaera sp.]|uniref:methyltransferase family protein n=1 Tax=Salinisphaera sp. TaxID=1914330 RepID=UPI002D765379|nr:isoprenylcysteine carboxylmethyltransferase family protein [Salinisphaera sp.]HET7313966.1 isoprenylcysteine carboxylmethyltransferase family protein [Salinisphaera sp.]
MKLLTSLGHTLFRTRNVVFPLLLIGVCLLLPPAALNAPGAGWVVLCGLLVLVLGQGLRVLTIGLDYIRRGGRDGRIHADRLVTGGVFASCRNPMYTGNVTMVIGFFALAGNLWGLIVGGAIGWLVYRAIIAAEESFLAELFGAEYAEYCRRVPRWLPAPAVLIRVASGHRFDWAAVVLREYGTLMTTAAIVLILLAVKAARAGTLDAWAPLLIALAGLTAVAWGVARFLKKSRRLRPWNAG